MNYEIKICNAFRVTISEQRREKILDMFNVMHDEKNSNFYLCRKLDSPTPFFQVLGISVDK